MSKTIAIADLEKSLRTVLDSVVKEHIPYVVTSDSQPEAALVPYDEFLRLQQLKEKEVLDRFDHAWAEIATRNAEFSDEEVARDVAEAQKELRR